MADLIFPGAAPSGTIGSTRLPDNLDLEIWKGDYQQFIIKMQNPDGTPINLTGYTAQAMIRASFTAPTSYPFTCTIGGTGNNEVTLYMSSANCKLIPAGDYVWNFQLTYPNGDTRTYLAGDVKVYAEVDG